MVSGINFSNYTVDQLKELKANGVSVPDSAITEAQEKATKEADEAKKSDEANVSYTISDDASQTNEAQAEVEAAAEYGANLKTILGTLISKCDTKNSEMAELQSSIDEFKTQAETTGNQLDAVATLIEQAVAKATQEVEAKQVEVEAKQDEVETKQAQAEDIVNNASPEGLTTEEQAKVTTLNSEIEVAGTSIEDLVGEMKDLQAETKKSTVSAEVKAQALGTTLENIKSAMTDTSNKAINANEYADVTIEKGTEASNITTKSDAKKAGFTKKGFLGFGKKGNVKAANNMGNQAIAKGEQLGGSTTKIAKGVQDVSKQFDLSFAKTSGIANLANKEYVDTEAFTEADNNYKDAKKGWSKYRAGRTAQSEANKVAEASKNKGKNNTEATGEKATTLEDLLKNKKTAETKTNA